MSGYEFHVVVVAITTLAVLALLTVAVRWLLGRSCARITLDPTCGGCGYIVTGLPTTTCPECGANLSKPGAIRAPGAVAPLPRSWVFFLWTAIFWLGYAVIEGVWLIHLPTVWSIEEQRKWGQPRSNAYSQISIDYQGEMYLNSPLRGTARLLLKRIDRSAAKSRLVYDIASNRCRQVIDQTPAGPELPLDADVVLQWMRNCGVDVSVPGVRDEAEVIVRGVAETARAVYRGTPEFSTGGGGGGMNERSTRAVQIIRTSLVLAWLAGLALLWRKSNRAWRVAILHEGPVQDVTTFDHLFEPTPNPRAEDSSQT